MKHIILAITAILAIGFAGCAHKASTTTCTDGKSCCAKKK